MGEIEVVVFVDVVVVLAADSEVVVFVDVVVVVAADFEVVDTVV